MVVKILMIFSIETVDNLLSIIVNLTDIAVLLLNVVTEFDEHGFIVD